MKIDHEFIKKLEEDCMLELNEKELNNLLKAGDGIVECLQKVMEVDTKGVEELYYPFDIVVDELRDDAKWTTVPQSEILKNAPSTDGDFITIKKVVG